MENFQKLDAWKIGLEIEKNVYSVVIKLPKDERYSSADQIKRASTSILANIAEASGRYTFKDKANKYIIARVECYEVAAFIYIFLELHFIEEKDAKQLLDLLTNERKILSGLISANRRRAEQNG